MPPGWRISGYGSGAVDVVGPQGQLAEVGIVLPIMVQPTFVCPVAGSIYLPFIADPAAAVPVVSQALWRQTVARGGQGTTNVEVLERYKTAPPTGAGQAAYLFARSRVGGRLYFHFGLVNTAPSDANSRTYYYSTVAAPDGVFQRDCALI